MKIIEKFLQENSSNFHGNKKIPTESGLTDYRITKKLGDFEVNDSNFVKNVPRYKNIGPSSERNTWKNLYDKLPKNMIKFSVQ